MPAGRPTELTPTVLEDFRRILPTVLYMETVADFIGVSRTSVHHWLKRGAREAKRLARSRRARPKESETIYVQFLNVYKKALAEGEIYDAGVIKKAASDQWQAAAWRLERRFPLHWGRQEVRELAELKAAVTAMEAQLARRVAKPNRTGRKAPGRG